MNRASIPSAATLAFMLAAPGCGDAGPSNATTTGGVGGTSSVTTTGGTGLAGGEGGQGGEGATGGQGGGPCPVRPVPEGVPEGWVHWGDWSCDCDFFVPGSPDVLPPPIEWETCAKTAPGVMCRSMVVHWTEHANTVGYYPRLDASGAVPTIGFRRALPDGRPLQATDIVAAVDGPVSSAIHWRALPGAVEAGCFTSISGLTNGHVTYTVNGHDAKIASFNSPHEGVISQLPGRLTPIVITHQEEPSVFTASWDATDKWIAKFAPSSVLSVSPWSPYQETFVTSPNTDPDGLPPGQPAFFGDALFFKTANQYTSGINVWTPASGAKPFVRFVGDYTRGAGNLGTDGVDLVWSQGEGKTPGATDYPTRDIMTAPFTSDPSALSPRRLRSDPFHSVSVDAFVVGCGYAVHKGGSQQNIVVRLSDGHAWFIPNSAPDFAMLSAFGLTCDELFTTVQIEGRIKIARIALDSLGPGVPAD